MTPPRPRHPKPDTNQAEIVAKLREQGMCVHDVSSLGGDILDLFVGGYNLKTRRDEWVQVEIKTEKGALTDGQQKYLAKWIGLPVVIARNAEDVLQYFGHKSPKRRVKQDDPHI